MTKWSLLDECEKKESIKGLPLSDKIKKGFWPDYLSIKEIADILHPIPKWNERPEKRSEVEEWRSYQRTQRKENKAVIGKLIKDCEDGLLVYEGKIGGWDYYGTNDYPLAKNGKSCDLFIPAPSSTFNSDWHSNIQGALNTVKYKCQPTDCTIHKTEFKRYLESVGKWPVEGKLAEWWGNGSPDSNNKKRDEVFSRWKEETDPELNDMTKKNVQDELMGWEEGLHRVLWAHDFDGWVKYTSLYEGRSGRRKKQKIS